MKDTISWLYGRSHVIVTWTCAPIWACTSVYRRVGALEPAPDKGKGKGKGGGGAGLAAHASARISYDLHLYP